MFREILGILSDIIGVVFIWWNPETLLWYWKLLISAGFVFIAIGFHFLTKDHPVAKVKDYCWEDNSNCILFTNKNNYYFTDMLVSIYMQGEGSPKLCAIGYVKTDPKERRLHVQVIHKIDAKAMDKIKITPKKCREFFIKPSVMQNDISVIKWE